MPSTGPWIGSAAPTGDAGRDLADHYASVATDGHRDLAHLCHVGIPRVLLQTRLQAFYLHKHATKDH
jgi:hypothetical protein